MIKLKHADLISLGIARGSIQRIFSIADRYNLLTNDVERVIELSTGENSKVMISLIAKILGNNEFPNLRSMKGFTTTKARLALYLENLELKILKAYGVNIREL